MISVGVKGDWKKTEKFLTDTKIDKLVKRFDEFGRRGIDALRTYTPRDTGKTAASWGYVIRINRAASTATITWTNSNSTATGVPIAVLIQYGHATRNGGYVRGRDFINPALRPVFDSIANDITKEVSKL